MKGVSQLVAAIFLIAIAIVIASIAGPWVLKSISQEGGKIGEESGHKIECSNVQYSLKPGYGTEGVEYSLCSEPRYIRAMIKNYGLANVYNLSFQVVTSQSSVMVDLTSQTQIAEINPVRPGEEVLLEGVPQECIEGTLQEIRILNGMGCPPAVYHP